MLFRENSGFDFLRPANLANHDHHFGFSILFKPFQDIPVRTADDRISTDTYRCRYADPHYSHLVGCFVAQRSRAGNNPDVTFDIDMPGHDPQHRSLRTNRTLAVGSWQYHSFFEGKTTQKILYGHHILRWNAIRNSYAVPDSRIGRFHNRIRRKRRRDKND